MTEQPTLAVKLFGTEEPVEPPRELRAGNLSAEFEAGNLRYIRFVGQEVMRAISYIVRDPDWGTYAPKISDLAIIEKADHFRVRYNALVDNGAQQLTYRADIMGRSDGTLTFQVQATPSGTFSTNRTGFVVLHPINGVAGEPVRIERCDGSINDSTFPRDIDPVQPMMDLRALTHWTSDGLEVNLRMEGDTFEMEDQRNWSDASYKTYVRPLARPWPYDLPDNTEFEQRVSLMLIGDKPPQSDGQSVSVSLGETGAGRMPLIGQALHPDNAQAVLENAQSLNALSLSYLLCEHNPQRGDSITTLIKQVEAAEALGAAPWLELVVTSVEGFKQELAHLGDDLNKAGITFDIVLVSPAADLKGTLPGSVWPDAPPAAELYAAARKAFPRSKIGGGMFVFFTELNRKRPPKGSLDLISFTTSSTVHAGDDRSVMETISTLPAIVQSAASIANGTPIAVGPSAIGLRTNPYANARKSNPQNIRQAMNWNDPRQRGLLGAAWAVGYITQFARGGASCVALGEPVGAFGAIHTATDFPQPWFEDVGGLYPVFHVLKALAGLSGQPLRALEVSDSSRVIGLAADTSQGTEIVLANLRPDDLQLELSFAPKACSILDASSFVAASQQVDFLDNWQQFNGSELKLTGYSVVRLLA
ncbi:MAG: hypothetical protein JKY99_08575 [Rhizobiales bacterium]|nr:hypothetical protein [Hyphomicrobiales bacterium]